MIRLRSLCGCLIAVVFAAASLSAQSPEGGQALPLAVDQAVDLALKYSKSLKASSEKTAGAEAKARETDTYRWPSLKFGGSYARLSPVPSYEIEVPNFGTFVIDPALRNAYNFQLTVQQPLFTGHQLSGASEAGRLQAQAAREEYLRDEAELVFAVRDAYWTVYKAADVKRLVDENVALIEAHLRDVRNFLDQGLAKPNDLLKVQVQLSSAKVTQLQSANAIRLAVMSLNSLIGLPVNGDIRVTSQVREPEAAEPEKLGALVARALENRPELKSAGFGIKAAEAGVKIAKSGRYPQVYLVGNYYMSNPNERIYPLENKFHGTWDIGVSLSLDLWNWNRAGAQTRQARAQLAQAENGAAQLRDAVTLEVSQNYFAVEQQKLAIRLAAEGVAQAEENYRVTRDRFKAGLALNSDLLDAEVALLQAKINHSRSMVDYEVLQAKLTKSVDAEGR
jgi:outer membrane protein